MTTADGPALVDIVLPGFPLALFARWQERFSDLMREFVLVGLSQEDQASVPSRLVALANEVTATYAGSIEQAVAAREEAMARGETTMDLHYRLPASAAAHAARLEEVMAEADEYCRRAELLTLAAPVEFVAFRHWYFGNAVRQCHGHSPVRWTGPLA